MLRYQTDDLPPGMAGAFMPIPAVMARSSAWGEVDVFGAPGTFAVDSPSPDGSLPTVSAQRGLNSARPSDQAPDQILPTIYVAGTRNMGPGRLLGLARRRYAELPVPAATVAAVPNAAPLQVTKGSRATLPWPRAFQRYPNQGGG